jgi:CRISPR-associated endonuclease Cas1
MRDERTTPLPPLAICSGILVLSGYGLRVAVHRKHLIVSDGVCDDRRQLRIAKATAGLRRLVILGHSGTITLEALRWLHDIGASIVQIDPDGQMILASGPGSHPDGRLRRAQALASTNHTGLTVVRYLLRQKLDGQAEVLDQLTDVTNVALVRAAAQRIDSAQTTKELRDLEAEGAVHYWRAWEGIPVGFARKEARHVPKHWRTFGTRSSPLTHSPRLAANPANAVLNYLYGVLETEARIACHAMGLDPSLGLLHADLEFRDSFLFDLMEAARPRVDAFLLKTLRSQVFRRHDFVETRRGVCRLTPDLAKRIAEMAPRLAQMIGPTVEHVVRMLITPTTRSRRPVPTRLTEANRSAGRRTSRIRRRGVVVRPDLMPKACRSCGVLLDESSRHLYCETCLPERRAEVNDRLGAAGPRALARIRQEGYDPAHGGRAARVRGRRNACHMKDVRSWEQRNGEGPDRSVFRETILPRLAGVSLTAMRRATGLSRGYCSFIRKGKHVPHPRHWESLRLLVQAQT